MSDESVSPDEQARGVVSPDAPPPGFRWRSLLLPAVLFSLVLVQASTVAVKVKAISPYDEAAHFDYVVQLQQGNFPVPAGQRYSEEAIQEWACRPTDKASSVAQLCGKPYAASDPGALFGGIDYEAPFGPVYYAIAAGGSSVLGHVGIGDFTGARLVSSFLYALGAALLLLVAQRLAFSSMAAGGLILAASSTGLSLSMGATITPDSMAFLVTAAVIASSLLTRTWRSAVLTTVLVGAVAGLTKPNFVVIAALGSMLLLLRWTSIEKRTLSWRSARSFLVAGSMAALPVLVSAAGSAGWAALAAARNTTGAPSDGGVHAYVRSALGPIERAAEQLSALLRPDGGTVPGPAFTVLDTPLLGAAGLVIVLVTLGACLCAWLWHIDADMRSLMVLRSVVLAVPICAIMLVVIYWASYQGAHLTASRYGIPFLAAASVGLGATLPRRTAIPIGVLGVAVWLSAWLGLVA